MDGTFHATGDSNLDGNTTVGKDFTVKGNTNLKDTKIDGTLETTGDATFDSNAHVKKDLTVDGDSVTKGNHTVEGDGHYKGNLTVDKDLTVNGNTYYTGNVIYDSDATFNKDVHNKGNTYTDGNSHVGKDLTVAGSTSIGKDLTVGGDIHADGVISASDAIIGGKSLSGELSRMGNQINGVGASAAALAALEYDGVEGGQKWQIAGGVGNYANKTATALGVKYHVNKDISFHMGATVGASENMVNGGFSIALGHGHPSITKEYQEELNTLKMAVNQLAASNEAMARQMAALTLDESKRASFPDVPEDHWAKEAVDVLYGNGDIKGYPDGKFHGNRRMTRYESAMMLYNALQAGKEVPESEVEEYKYELTQIRKDKKVDLSGPSESIDTLDDLISNSDI